MAENALSMGSGRRGSNSRPSAWEGDEKGSRTAPPRPASSRDAAPSDGSEDDHPALTVPHRPERVRQEVRHTAMSWWDAMHDEGAVVAWGLWRAGRS